MSEGFHTDHRDVITFTFPSFHNIVSVRYHLSAEFEIEFYPQNDSSRLVHFLKTLPNSIKMDQHADRLTRVPASNALFAHVIWLLGWLSAIRLLSGKCTA